MARSLSNRVNSLEEAIAELREALEPRENRVIFWTPGMEEPDTENLPRGVVVVRMASPYLHDLPTAEQRRKDREEFDTRVSAKEQETQAAAIKDVMHSPKEADDSDIYGRNKDGYKTWEAAIGVRWGFPSPGAYHRHKLGTPARTPWERINKSGIF